MDFLIGYIGNTFSSNEYSDNDQLNFEFDFSSFTKTADGRELEMLQFVPLISEG